jgi:hypothetical protein
MCFFFEIWILGLECMGSVHVKCVTWISVFLLRSGYLYLVAQSSSVHVERVTYCYMAWLLRYIMILSLVKLAWWPSHLREISFWGSKCLTNIDMVSWISYYFSLYVVINKPILPLNVLYKINTTGGSNILEHPRIVDEVFLCHWSKYLCVICKWYLISKVELFVLNVRFVWGN